MILDNPRAFNLDKNPAPKRGAVVYVMSRDQRVADNHALLLAQSEALRRKSPLLVVFFLQKQTGNRAQEHYVFMLKGLAEIGVELKSYHIPFLIRTGNPVTVLRSLEKLHDVSTVIMDFNPLRGPQNRFNVLHEKLTSTVIEVDTHNIVPARLVSDKQEYGARTIRPKIQKLLPEFLVEPGSLRVHPYTAKLPDELRAGESLHLPRTVKANGTHIAQTSGEMAAREALDVFIKERLKGYASRRNDPSLDGLSKLSPYLHFGQLASLRAVLDVEIAVANDQTLRVDADAFIEEIVVRKELSDNYCLHNKKYDSLRGAPDWAQKTLHEHADDPRDQLYSLPELEGAQTHDPAWNAAQRELRVTGKMHGYMRMYWAKKVLEWSPDATTAIKHLMYLNDFYSIDGGDPNGYVGILWSVAGLHDRPWSTRAVFGSVRYMNYQGLKRKFDITAYQEHWDGSLSF